MYQRSIFHSEAWVLYRLILPFSPLKGSFKSLLPWFRRPLTWMNWRHPSPWTQAPLCTLGSYPTCSLKAGVFNLQDLMSDDLRWSWCNNNRNKVHNKCNALESSWNHPPPPPPGLWKNCLPQTGPWCPKGWDWPSDWPSHFLKEALLHRNFVFARAVVFPFNNYLNNGRKFVSASHY